MKILSAQGRESRLGYALTNAGIVAVFFLIFYLSFKYVPNVPLGPEVALIILAAVFIFIVLSLYIFAAAAIKRFHDLNKSGWFFLLLLVPFVNVAVLLFLNLKSGDIKNNRFGPEPDIVSGEILIVIMIWVGIVLLYNNVDKTYIERWRKESFGQYQMSSHDIKSDIDQSTEAIKKDPMDSHAYGKRGYAYFQEGKLDKAIADFTRAIEIRPDYEWAYHTRAGVYELNGEVEAAFSDYNKVIELNPSNSKAFVDRGILYDSAKGDLKKALADFNSAIVADPESATAYYNRGYCYSRMWDSKKAIADYSRAIEINGQRSDAYNNRANEYIRLEQYDKARADVDVLQKNNIPVPSDLLEKLKNSPKGNIPIGKKEEPTLVDSKLEEKSEPVGEQKSVDFETKTQEPDFLTSDEDKRFENERVVDEDAFQIEEGKNRTLILNSGKTIDVKIIEKNDRYIKVDYQGIELKFYEDEIKEIK